MATERLAWFELLLNPSLLESHLNQKNPGKLFYVVYKLTKFYDLLIHFEFLSIKL